MAERSRSRVAMLFLDLDNFKRVNDTLGHVAGDQLLLEVVTRLSRCTRESDTISRQGGDEFILLLNDIPDPETVVRIANEILTNMSEPLQSNGHALNVSCSIGIAITPRMAAISTACCRRPTRPCIAPRRLGRNTYRFSTAR